MHSIELDVTIRHDIRDLLALKAREYTALWYAVAAMAISLSSLAQ